MSEAIGPDDRRATIVVGAGVVVANLSGLAVLALTARWLGPVDYGTFLAGWGVIFGIASVVAAVEQDIVRAAALARLRATGIPLDVVRQTGVAVILGLGVVALLAATPVGSNLLGADPARTVIVVASVVGTGGLVLVRGCLLGSGLPGRYTALLSAEALLRVLVLAVLVTAGVSGSVQVALAVVALGMYAWIPFAPSAAGLASTSGSTRERHPARSAGAVVVLASSAGLAALLVAGYPAFASALLGSRPELALTLSVVTLGRVPLVLLAPVQTLAVPVATRLRESGAHREMTRLLAVIAVSASAAATASFAIGWWAGPPIAQLVLGAAYDPAPLLTAAVLATTCFLGAALLQAAVLVAFERYGAVMATWLSGSVAGGCALALAPGEGGLVGVSGFVAGSLTAFVVSAWWVNHSTRRDGVDVRLAPGT